MTPHDARLAPAAGAAWLVAAGVVLGWGWVPLGAVVLVVGTVWCGGVVLPPWRGPLRAARPALALALLAALLGLCAGLAAQRDAAPLRRAVGHAATVTVVARTDAVPAPGADGLWRVDVQATSVDGAAARAALTVWSADLEGVARGERLTLTGVVSAREGGDPSLWRPTVRARASPRGIDALVAGLRAGLREATRDVPGRLQPLARGMVIGDDSGMSQEQKAQMSSAGLTHLTAVSGSHFAIVLVAVTALLRTVVRSRRVVAAVTGGAMGMLVCVVFPEPSVTRAATMAAVICAALWWGRPAHALPALSAGLIAVSLTDPRLACEPGFAMSVAAVAAIALWAPALAVRLEHGMPPVLAHPLAVCVAAQAAVLPLLALIDGGVSPWSVLANLAVGWCAAPVTLVGLAALVVAPASAGLAHLLGTAAGWASWPVDAVARAASGMPGAHLTVPPGPWGAAGSAAAVAVAIALTFAVRLRMRLPVVALVVVLAVAAMPLVPRLMARDAAVPSEWKVVACDVGQGDAMLLRSGTHSAVAIDVGPGEGAGADCLARYGVRRIDLLIITHPHEDHEGALPQILDETPVTAAWISPAEAAEPTASTRALASAGVPVTVAHAGDREVVGDLSVTLLAPQRDTFGDGSTGLNDASIVTLASVDGITVLGLGDLEHEGQRDLARGLGPLVVDVVKIPHHGSDRQEQALANLVSARVAVVSVGAGNSYGHPAPGALEMWGARVGTLVRTDLCGDVVITAGPGLVTSCPTDMAG